MTEHPDRDDNDLIALAYPYALDAVSDQERRDIEARLHGSDAEIRAAFEDAVRAVRGTMAATASATETPPPSNLRKKILDALDDHPQNPPVEAPEELGNRHRRFRWLFVATVAAGITALTGTGLIVTQLADSTIPSRYLLTTDDHVAQRI